MLDLGEGEIAYHKQVGLKINGLDIDKVYLYGNLSRYIAEVCEKEIFYFEDKYELAKKLANNKNCTILFKASRGLKMEEVIEKFKEIKQ